jgi:hypothetical protein
MFYIPLRMMEKSIFELLACPRFLYFIFPSALPSEIEMKHCERAGTVLVFLITDKSA